MRLHTLTLHAVGPFAGRYTVDFAALSAGGLFLLEGPTGAGKSTIIDAVVFALYGKVAAASASEDRLRSAFADESVESVVDLCFETGHGVYRVRRTPAYDRPKKRGTGTVRQQATVKLWRLTAVPDDPQAEPVGEIVSTRLDEAGAELTRIIGLERGQFVQTMVLPQGEFASFLAAEPEQRRMLLQRIFGTEIYDRVEQQLAEARRAAEREVESSRAAVQSAVDRFAGAAQLTEPLTARVAEDLPAVVQEIGELSSAVRATAAASATTAEATAARAAQSAEQVQAAVERVRRVERWAALTAEQAQLVARSAQHDRDRERVDLARRAGAVAPLLRGWDESRERVTSAAKELDAAVDRVPAGWFDGVAFPGWRGQGRSIARDALTGAFDGGPDLGVGSDLGVGADLNVDPAAVAELTAWRDRARDHVATLSRLVDLESALDRRAEVLHQLRAAADRCRTAVTELDLALAQRPQERVELVAALDAATELAHTIPSREQTWRTATEVLAAVREHADVAAQHTRATQTRGQAAAAAVEAAEREHALRQARLRGIAGELAGTLTDGEPCPVCGAVEHPAPTALAADHITAEQVEAAEELRRQAEERLRVAESEVSALSSRLSALAERTGGRDLDAAESEVRSTAAALDEARAAEADRRRCADRLAAHDGATEELRTRRESAVTEQTGAEHAAEQAERDLDADRTEVAAARDGHPTVAARQSAERSRAEAADAVLDAWGALAAARTAVADWRQRVDDALRQYDFVDDTGAPDADAARAGVLDPADTAALDAAVRGHLADVDRVTAGLAEPELAGIDATTDLDAARAEQERVTAVAAEHRALAEQAAAAAAVDRGRAEDAADAEVQVRAAADSAAELLRRSAPISRMARLAAGQDGGQGLSLGTYVLQRRFEDVVAAANDRLRPMSDGRFELVTSQEKESRSRKVGLGLRMVDHHSGDVRSTRTISGGETFYVSLCLALGLADVVSAEAGGIELGTLFIDEGFGSLDPEMLDAVLTELAHLRAGGRVVGLVSHVEAMKSAIAERIAVRRRADGSSSLTVIAG
ncbi:SMC family ATPase [Cellulomonas sp. NPDC089187]|uniref:SMC family ATPase n=1 Tax=Cellulomonas sp. NPDC089187 TaxID=3154970 RepID=UPI003439E143